MYAYWRRMALHPSLEILNAPARDNCVVRRDVANVPTQALVLLNDPIFTEAASAFAAVCWLKWRARTPSEWSVLSVSPWFVHRSSRNENNFFPSSSFSGRN